MMSANASYKRVTNDLAVDILDRLMESERRDKSVPGQYAELMDRCIKLKLSRVELFIKSGNFESMLDILEG